MRTKDDTKVARRRTRGVLVTSAAVCTALVATSCSSSTPLATSNGSARADASTSPGLLTIDDMEEHPETGLDALSPSAFIWGTPSVRIGNWFVSWSDGSTQDVGWATVDPPRNESHRAREVVRGDAARSANVWAQLDHPGGRPVDLSAFVGVTFWARLTGAEGKLVVALDGGTSGGAGYFKAQSPSPGLFAQTIDVSDQWTQFTLPFATFGGEPSGVVSIDFIVAGDAEPFDAWIDDLALVCHDVCP